MIWSLLVNDIFIFILCVNVQLYFANKFMVQDIQDEEIEVDYDITNTWTPPLLTWFVLCIRTSENNEEESVSPSLM